ncbi:MAG: choice-of-anchor R domain-containing protein [bacterium]|nr:choice-of-anchor R domain-containing protein [bacterium]
MDVKLKQLNNNSGQVALAVTLFALMISLAFGLGLGAPVIKETKNYRDQFNSEQSFYTAESGVEDAVYRLKNTTAIDNLETLFLGGATSTTQITNVTGGREITAAGDWRSLLRRLTAVVTVGQGAAFHYGVQAGAGGFELENNAGVNGNVYANGSIEGENGAYITGSAIAASSATLEADQVNDLPVTPINQLRFRDGNSTEDLALSFKLNSSNPLNKVSLYIRKNGNPNSSTVKLVTDNNDLPSTNIVTSGTLSSSQVTNAWGWVDISFATAPALQTNTTYWLVIDSSSNSANHYYELAANQDGYTNGISKIGSWGGNWSNPNPSNLDGYFKIYLGGLIGLIDNVDMGTDGTGDAYAHTVTNSSIVGALYCQSGSGNNKTCNPSKADPSPQPFPISDGNIVEWKTEAETGGTYNGNYVINDDTGTIGPKKIIGNLTISNNATLTLTGTVWVTGTISLSNNSLVRLASGYGANSGVLITDSYVDISNNGTFAGSGTSGSYLMVLTTSDCPLSSSCNGHDAIHVANNAGTVILNAQKGTISFADNSGTKAVTAYRLVMENNAVVNYDSGLINQNFTNGPAGGFNISSWGETE